MKELFDVLNEQGIYTNQIATREECHEKGLWHKAVTLFIINSKEQVLLQKRSAAKKMWPNLWDITAGGHVSAGELGFEAVIRETKEELGITICPKDILFLGSAISINENSKRIDKHFNEFYVINKDINLSDVKLQTEEVSEVKWFEKNDIIEKIENKSNQITDKSGCWEYLTTYYYWKDKK